MEEIQKLVENQRNYFYTGETIPVAFRKKMLKNLSECIKKYTPEILEALHTDLNKSRFEAYVTEISIVQEEISYKNYLQLKDGVYTVVDENGNILK